MNPSWCAFAISCVSLLLVPTCLADTQAFVQDERYNEGLYGRYVTQRFHTTDVEAPRLNFMKPFTNCDDGSYLFIAPRGNVADSTPYILDAAGALIWGPSHHYGEVYNFQVQRYKGEDYLTFWAGDDSVGGHGAGKYYMLDRHYEEVHQIEAANNLDADLHEFKITEDDTALISVYEVIQADFSELKGGKKDGYVWDWLFQEIDLGTGEAIFQWRASEHIKWSEVYPGVDGNGGEPDKAWDFFHGNTVDKDAQGNYLASGRFTRSVFYVSGTTGEVLWRLGGKHNDFEDLSGGKATKFAGQHHTQFEDNYTSIVFFDNRADWFEAIDKKSVGTKLKIDTEAMTVELAQTFVRSENVLSVSQGSYQTLPNGNVLLGYGFNGLMTEFSPEGDELCDALMMPSKDWGSGNVQSYRNFKCEWTGLPNTKPDLVLQDGVFYMSWLGSTEVRSWSLRQAIEEDQHFDEIAHLPKDGFETHYTLQPQERVSRFVQVVALDKDGNELEQSGTVKVFDDETMRLVHGPADDEDEEDEPERAKEPEKEEEPEDEMETHQKSVQARILALVGFCSMVVFTAAFIWVTLRKKAVGGWIRVPTDEEKRAFLARESEAGVGLMSEDTEAPGGQERDGNNARFQDGYRDSPSRSEGILDIPSRPGPSARG